MVDDLFVTIRQVLVVCSGDAGGVVICHYTTSSCLSSVSWCNTEVNN